MPLSWKLTRREVQSCTDLNHMRQLTLSVLDLMEGQRQFFLDQLKGLVQFTQQ